MGMNWLLDPIRSLDQRVVQHSLAQEALAREVGQRRNADLVNSGRNDREVAERIVKGGAYRDPDGAVNYLGLETGKDRQDFSAYLQDLMSGGGRQQVVDLYGQDMARGPGGMSGRGVMERLHGTMASNPYVRRGVIGGGGVMAGAGMTAGAQQLLALIEYMQQGQQTAQRAEQSPLT